MPLAALTLLLASQGTAAPAAPARTPSAAVAPAAAPKVKTTDLAPGTGAVAIKPGDLVEVNYVGKLTDGKEFDRSKDAPFRVQVGLGKVIAGWDQGLLGMKVGGKRRLEIPAALGYGAQGAAPVIPPNADLDFEVEVVSIRRATIQVVKAGTGDPLTPNLVPTFHYVLTLTDGKKIDSSRDRNVPASAPLANLIPGFVQGLLGMRPGEIRKVTVPPELAYGAVGVPPNDVADETGKVVAAKGSVVPPNATLVFEIELVSAVNPATAPGSGSAPGSAPGSR